MRRPYKYYRFLFNPKTSSTYTTINELRAYLDRGKAGMNIMPSATLSSNGQYQTQAPSFANDENPVTYWESTSYTSPNLNWLQAKFSSPVEILKFEIVSSAYPNEKPENFDVQVSDDGIAWLTVLAIAPGFMTSVGPNIAEFDLWKGFTGYSKLENNTPSSRVVLLDWDTMDVLTKTTPDIDGKYYFPRYQFTRAMIVHKGPIGYKPICDGPIEWGEL